MRDADHNSRIDGHGAQEVTIYGRRTRDATHDQSTIAGFASVAASFEFISLGGET